MPCHHLPLDQPIFFPQNPVVNNHFCPLLSSYEWAWWGSPSTDLGPGVTASLSRRPCPPQGRGSPVGMRCPGRDHGGRAQPAPGWPQVPPVQRLQQIQGPSHPQTPWRTALGSRETPWLRRAGREGEGSPLHPAHPPSSAQVHVLLSCPRPPLMFSPPTTSFHPPTPIPPTGSSQAGRSGPGMNPSH